MKHHYMTLGVPEDATADDIKSAYRKLAMIHHPDKNNGSRESTELFKKISEAYEVLSDPGKRAEYDLTLLQYRQAEKKAADDRRKAEEAKKKAAQEQSNYHRPSQSHQSSSGGGGAMFGLGLLAILVLLSAAFSSDKDERSSGNNSKNR